MIDRNAKKAALKRLFYERRLSDRLQSVNVLNRPASGPVVQNIDDIALAKAEPDAVAVAFGVNLHRVDVNRF